MQKKENVHIYIYFFTLVSIYSFLKYTCFQALLKIFTCFLFQMTYFRAFIFLLFLLSNMISFSINDMMCMQLVIYVCIVVGNSRQLI